MADRRLSRRAAPRFDIVSKPNNWNKLVTQATGAIDEAELSGTRALQLAWGVLGVVPNEVHL